ncbi:Tetratricopeptide repeat [Carpediemonas membranifera]|uniref:Tetratricopeptide repeat n=1 Tax=Carpediemonas membranifera TaxID=201153 RepID=A0A8J6AWV4_9EUKA|nr:Tetratricopeptide repeat [Carpediemonas membranifera]|eukprot:KAG9396163.1 Tetratricopeptide repeat [Carpediemonas membranifera]
MADDLPLSHISGQTQPVSRTSGGSGKESSLEYLKRVEETTVTLLDQGGKESEAIVLLLEAVKLREHIYGFSSLEAWRLACQCILLINRHSLSLIREGKLSESEHLLKQALVLESPRGFLSAEKERLKLRAITLNNYASLYKAQGQFKEALQTLKKAVVIEEKIDIAENPAGTMLNMCVICSHLDRHQDALSYAQEAIILIREDMDGPDPAPVPAGYPCTEALLAVAYHNLAVELEHLERIPRALKAYLTGYRFAFKHCGPDHEITHMNKAAYDSASVQHADNVQISIPHGKPEKETRPVGHSQRLPQRPSTAQIRRRVGEFSHGVTMPAWRATAASETRHMIGKVAREKFNNNMGAASLRKRRGASPYETLGTPTPGIGGPARGQSARTPKSAGPMTTRSLKTPSYDPLEELSPVTVDPMALNRIMMTDNPIGTTPAELMRSAEPVEVNMADQTLPFDKYMGVQVPVVESGHKEKKKRRHSVRPESAESARPNRPRRRHIE